MLTDEMFGIKENSLTDQLFANQEGDLTDQLFPKKEVPIVTPPPAKPKEDIFESPVFKDTIQGKMVSSILRSSKEEVTWTDEPLHEAAKKAIVDVAKTQGENILATGELAANLTSSMLLYIPSKLYGVMALPFGREVADVAEEEMARLGYQPMTEAGQRSAELVGKGFELFLTPARNVGEEVSKLSPEVGYLVEFGAELAEFAVTGGIVKGIKAKFKPRIEQATKILDAKHKLEQETIDKQIKEVEGIPNEVIKTAQKKILESEKTQLELKAKDMMEKLDYGKMIKEDLEGKGRKVVEVKQAKKYIADEAINKAMEKVKKVEGKEIEPTKDINKLIDKDKVTDLDLQTGTREPIQLDTEHSPFRESTEVTTQRTELYREVLRGVEKDPELFTDKLINDVNSWLDGNDVPIKDIRNGLSELATRAEEIKDRFMENENYPFNFVNWKEMVSEAASWARKAERGKGDVQLNMMIPIDEIPKAARWLWKNVKESVVPISELYRNKKLWEESGFWLGQDGLWRYEISDKGLKINPELLTTFRPGKTETSTYLLSEIVDHPTLYKAVPELRTINIKANEDLELGGLYNPNTHTIEVKYPSKDTIVHEVQHAVNEIVESKFVGTNVEVQKAIKIVSVLDKLKNTAKSPKVVREIDAAINLWQGSGKSKSLRSLTYPIEKVAKEAGLDEYRKVLNIVNAAIKEPSLKAYMKDPGEMESRLVEKRLTMTDKERANTPPWKTLDKMLEKEGIGKSEGTKLYDIGGATTEGVKQIVEGAKRARDYVIEARGMKSFKPMQAAKMLKEELKREWVDRSGNIRVKLLDKAGQAGYEVIQKMYLSKGASSISAEKLKQMQKEVYRGLSGNEKRVLDTLIFHNRMVDLAKYKTSKQFKYFKDHPPSESIAYIELVGQLEKLSPERVSALHRRAEAYFEWMKKPLKDMLDSGLISEQEFTDLSSHNYRKLKLVDIYDKRYQAKIGKRKRTVYDSGIESLARGRNTDIFEPSSEVMALEVFNRAYGRIMNNEANKALLDLARSDKENPFVRVKEGKEDKIPSGWNRLFLYEEGKRRSIYISPEMSKEWITNNPEMSYKMSQLIRYASGSIVLRTFATGINWGFAVANLPRDVMHTWFTARTWKDGKWKHVYSPHAPVFAMQIGRDLLSVFNDAALRKGRYEKYINEGGGMEFMVHQGRILQRGRHLEGSLDKAQDILGYFGETSEIMTRLAIRERVLRKGGTPQEATFAARDYMDFGQGGGIAKASDNGIPYLNASIQGTRGIFRSFKDNPIISTYKLTQLGGAVVGMYIASKHFAPKTSEELKRSIDSQNNFCIPLPDLFRFIDNNGQERGIYFKIPLDPGQKFFKKFFEAATDKWLGEEIDVEGTVEALKSFSPVSGVSGILPPSVSGVLGYVTNKNFWLNEDIWKQSKPFKYPGSKEEYTSRTPEAFIDIGQATRLSPERLKYAVEELVTSGTVWSYLAGQGYDAAFGDLPKEKKEQHLAMVLSKIPIVKRFIGVTNPYTKFAEKMDKAQEEVVLKDFVENRNFDIQVEGYLYGEGVSRQDVIKEAKQYKDIDTYDRLMDRLTFEEGIKDLPEKSFWRRMKGLRTEAKVKVFVDHLQGSTSNEKKQLWKEYDIVDVVGGVVSEEFLDEVERQLIK